MRAPRFGTRNWALHICPALKRWAIAVIQAISAVRFRKEAGVLLPTSRCLHHRPNRVAAGVRKRNRRESGFLHRSARSPAPASKFSRFLISLTPFFRSGGRLLGNCRSSRERFLVDLSSVWSRSFNFVLDNFAFLRHRFACLNNRLSRTKRFASSFSFRFCENVSFN